MPETQERIETLKIKVQETNQMAEGFQTTGRNDSSISHLQGVDSNTGKEDGAYGRRPTGKVDVFVRGTRVVIGSLPGGRVPLPPHTPPTMPHTFYVY